MVSRRITSVRPLWAIEGGRVTLGYLGSFDSLNPYIIRGVSPPSLRELVFESLLARSGDEPFSLYGLIAETIEIAPDPVMNGVVSRATMR